MSRAGAGKVEVEPPVLGPDHGSNVPAGVGVCQASLSCCPRDPPIRRLDRSPGLAPLRPAGRPCPGAAGLPSGQPGRATPEPRSASSRIRTPGPWPMVRRSGARLREHHRARRRAERDGTISTARSSGSGSAWPGPSAPGRSSSWTPASAAAIPDFSTDFSTGTTASSASPCPSASAARTTPSCISSSCPTARCSPGARPACSWATSGCRPACATAGTCRPSPRSPCRRPPAPAGYGRGVVAGGIVTTVRAPLASPLVYEGSIGLGYTPRHGDLTATSARRFCRGARGSDGGSGGVSRSTATSSSTRPYYHDTTMPALDRRELSLDFGWILATRAGREWRLGLTEDLEPGGPGSRSGLPAGGDALRAQVPTCPSLKRNCSMFRNRNSFAFASRRFRP